MVAASAIGWYGDTGGREVDESAPAGQSFLARLVRDWETAAEPAADAGIRVVHIRSGLVLTPHGGILARLLPPARLGVLPRFASGRQVMSWISLSDEIGAIRFLLDREDISGPVNLPAPEPVTNAAFRRPANLFPLRFGNDSFKPHHAAAQATGKPCVVLNLPGIAADVDNAEDLERLLALPGETRAQRLAREFGLGGAALPAPR